MRVATWNVNSIKARLSHVLGWLAARQPDVVCLQELKLTDDKFPHLELRAAGYFAIVHGQAGWNGVAVLSRERAELRQAGLPGADDSGARLLTVDVAGIDVSSVYVPNGKTVFHPDFRMKLGWLERLREHLAESCRSGRPALVGGDFNVCHRDRDSHSPEGLAGRIFHTTEERAAIDQLLGCGLTDLYRHKHPEGGDYSWWDYRAGCFHKNQGLRIDLLLGTPDLAARASEVWIDRDWRKKQVGETPSDHAPVLAEL